MKNKKREIWDKQDWIMTIVLCIIFPPFGIAAILRWLTYKSVWY